MFYLFNLFKKSVHLSALIIAKLAIASIVNVASTLSFHYESLWAVTAIISHEYSSSISLILIELGIYRINLFLR
jgi:hypothetical protein